MPPSPHTQVGGTALTLASYKGHVEAVMVLLKGGAHDDAEVMVGGVGGGVM